MTSLLAPCMVRHPTVKPALETFLMTHILHEFNAPEGYMRYIVRLGPGAIRFLWTQRLTFVLVFPGLSSFGKCSQVRSRMVRRERKRSR